MPALHLARFTCDVTPPVGHPLLGGWRDPVRGVDDPLQAIGVVLLGMGAPVVLCAVDWCGLRNDAHLAWKQALAKAAHTHESNVAVQCIHQHDAPFADVEAERLITAVPGKIRSLDLKFFDEAIGRTAEAIKASLATTTPLTHVGIGQAKVEQVASNRRILGTDGKVKAVRFSATKDEKVRAEPEGLIDSWLKSVSFWNDTEPLSVLHYYATHPMSYYGKGRVSCDFCGLARAAFRKGRGGLHTLYFTGCAGNITAGKYNDGSPEQRPVLRDRMLRGMTDAWTKTEKHRLAKWDWRVEAVTLPPRAEKSFGLDESKKLLEDAKETPVRRINAAFQMAWLKRVQRPIELSCLDLGKVLLLHLPGEPFIEFQLAAQELRNDATVCTAGYGDGGPGYIPTVRAFVEGGYEPTVALAAPRSEEIIRAAMKKLLVV